MSKFFVLSLPRSRSKWLSEFLSYAGKRCGHDLLVECASAKDFAAALARVDGTCETGAVLGWRLLREEWPDAKLITIHRPVEEVMWSFYKQGLQVNRFDMELRADMLQACAKSEGVLSFSYSSLANSDVCASIFAHCLDLSMEYDWWAEMSKKNIQIDLAARGRRLVENAPKLEALKLDIAARSSKLGGASWARLN